MVNKKLLFISWDGPHVNYLEGLFIPIFKELQHSSEIHIIQFSWNDTVRSNRLRALCKQYGIIYTHQTVWVKPLASIGKYFSLWRGALFLARYIAKHRIGVVMPRSTMPAKMILFSRVFYRNYQLIFDADGLPIEERVEFAGLELNSFRYRLLKKAERRIFECADRILARSHRAAQYLSSQHGIDSNKFAVVTNGRDNSLFIPASVEDTDALRKKLNIPHNAFVLAYVGSLGPQYGIEQMFFIYQQLKENYSNTYFLLLTTNPDYLTIYGIEKDANLIVKTLSQAEIPAFLSIANVGLAIRKSSPAMMGVAPIKLGEYLLMGVPVIASTGIGDTERLLSNQRSVHLLADYSTVNLKKAADWAIAIHQSANPASLKEEARRLGLNHFVLSKSVNEYKEVLNGLGS